jgi:hypothetical protein
MYGAICSPRRFVVGGTVENVEIVNLMQLK